MESLISVRAQGMVPWNRKLNYMTSSSFSPMSWYFSTEKQRNFLMSSFYRKHDWEMNCSLPWLISAKALQLQRCLNRASFFHCAHQRPFFCFPPIFSSTIYNLVKQCQHEAVKGVHFICKSVAIILHNCLVVCIIMFNSSITKWIQQRMLPKCVFVCISDPPPLHVLANKAVYS